MKVNIPKLRTSSTNKIGYQRLVLQSYKVNNIWLHLIFICFLATLFCELFSSRKYIILLYNLLFKRVFWKRGKASSLNFYCPQNKSCLHFLPFGMNETSNATLIRFLNASLPLRYWHCQYTPRFCTSLKNFFFSAIKL